MKYLNTLVLPVAISAVSLGSLNAKDPVENFAKLLHAGAQGCRTRQFNTINFTAPFKDAVFTVTQKQAVQAFQYEIDGQDAISRARSNGGRNCLEYAETIEKMKKTHHAIASISEAANLTFSELDEKRKTDPKFRAKLDIAIASALE